MNKIITAAALAAATGLASAGSIDINGGTSWNGWTARGNSQDVGVYSTGSRLSNFSIYTTTFKYNSAIHEVSGSTLGNSTMGSFAQDAAIFAIGIQINNGSDLTLQVPTLKFDLTGEAGFQAESAFDANDGIQGSSRLVNGGFVQQFNGIQNASQSNQASYFGLYSDATQGDGPNSTANLAANASFVRSFYAADGSGFQLFFDLKAYADQLGTATPINGFNLILNADGTSVLVSNLAVVPLPPAAWAGLATLGAAFGVRKLRRR